MAPTTADYSAAQEATVVYRHIRPANTPAGAAQNNREIATRGTAPSRQASRETAGTRSSSAGTVRFPGDVTYFGGALVEFAESHPIYMLPNGNCPIATCWGNPEGFLNDLGRSELIHVVDPYVGLFASNRYTLGAHARINYTPTKTPLTDANILTRLHIEASRMGSGYGHIYHFFLPRGQDECVVDGVCYSPDNPDTFVFCGYHGSVDFKDIGHVLYSVEPFQNVDGCNVRRGTPNGQLVDSTNNTLSHEVIETITDPDGDAWFNFSSVPLGGQEIADECSFFVFVPPNSFFFDPSIFTVRGHRYAVQPEYSNSEHGCTMGQ